MKKSFEWTIRYEKEKYVQCLIVTQSVQSEAVIRCTYVDTRDGIVRDSQSKQSKTNKYRWVDAGLDCRV